MSIEHPKTTNEITRDWIGFVLEEAGVCKNSQVIAIDIKPLGGDVSGFLSSICRVNVSYDSLQPGMPPSYVIKFPPAQEINAVRAISKFHAQWLDSPKLKRLDWMPYENRDIKNSYAENWPEFKEEHSGVLTGKDTDAGDQISLKGEKIEELIRSAPTTIAHTDFRADNLMFKG